MSNMIFIVRYSFISLESMGERCVEVVYVIRTSSFLDWLRKNNK